MAQSESGLFATRWGELAIDETVDIAVDTTITPRTLAALQKRDGSPLGEPPPLATLPRISLDWSERAGEQSMTHGADIVLFQTLGSGGMGKVCLGRQRSLDREVAVKLLHDSADDSLVRSLISEAVLTGCLGHPGIVPVHSLGLDDRGRPVLVMKRIEGASWAELCKDPDHPAWPEWERRSGSRLLAHLEILSQVCDAVHFAHSRGVVHLDIKPDNVMLGGFGEVYLVDWGIAVRIDRQTPGGLVGTPAYMAPEMVAGTQVGPTTDVYLLGATLHEVLTGRPRHPGGRLRDVLAAAFASERVDYSEGVPPLLAELCNQATSADPTRRPSSALAFRAAIGEFLRHRSSIELSEVARARLAELDTLIAEARQMAPEQFAVQASALAAEARFGFSQALGQWQDNPQAREGLDQCQLAQLEVHLLRRDGPAAAGLLASMEGAPPDLRRRVEALLDELDQEQREKDRLKALEHDLDPAVGRSGRLLAYLMMAVVGVGIAAVAYFQEGGMAAITHRQTWVFSLVVAAATAIVLTVKRREMFANAFNRRGIGLVVLAVTMLVIDRSIAWAIEMPMQHLMILDSIMLATAWGGAAATWRRWAALSSLTMVGSAVAVALLPPYWAPMVFTLATLVAIFVAVVFWRHD